VTGNLGKYNTNTQLREVSDELYRFRPPVEFWFGPVEFCPLALRPPNSGISHFLNAPAGKIKYTSTFIINNCCYWRCFILRRPLPLENFSAALRPVEFRVEFFLPLLRALELLSKSMSAATAEGPALPAAGLHPGTVTQDPAASFGEAISQTEIPVYRHEGVAFGWSQGQLRYIDDFDGGSFVAMDCFSSLGWLQVFWIVQRGQDLKDAPRPQMERDAKGKVTYLRATCAGPSDGSEMDCRVPLGVPISTDDISLPLLEATSLSEEDVEALLI